MAKHSMKNSFNAIRVAIQHNQDETTRLQSTFETTTSIDLLLSQTTDPSTPPSQTGSSSSKAPIDAIESSVAAAPPKSSHQGHTGNFGTVVSEAEIPKKWGPKFLDVEKAQADRFLGYMVLVFAVTMIGIIGIGWWRGLWKSKIVRRAFVDRGHGNEG